jgi:hypothetical protein
MIITLAITVVNVHLSIFIYLYTHTSLDTITCFPLIETVNERNHLRRSALPFLCTSSIVYILEAK